MRFVLGIDPGCTGAFALLSEFGHIVAMGDLPIVRDGASVVVLDGSFGFDVLRAARNYNGDSSTGFRVMGVIERLHGREKDFRGSATMKSASVFGGCVYAMSSNQIPVEFVSSASWKAFYGLQAPKEKDAVRKRKSLDKARLLFPDAELDRAKDHNRAEALLIAEFFRKTRVARE